MHLFGDITALDGESPPQVRQAISIDGDCIVRSNGRSIVFEVDLSAGPAVTNCQVDRKAE